MVQTTTSVLQAIKTLTERHGIPPTVREIQAEAGLSSTSVVQYHLKALKRDGRVSYLPNKSRTVRVRE